MSTKLPPLPASQYAFADPEGFGPDIPAFSADQMCAYAEEALKARMPLTDQLVAALEAVWYRVPLLSEDLRSKVDAAISAAKEQA